MDFKKKIISSVVDLPLPLNSFLLKINHFPRLIYGKKYYENRINFQRNSEIIQTDRLINIVNFAIKHTPYYSAIYKENINNIKDFENKIGFINREIIVKQFESFISADIKKRKYVEALTGGTLGKPAKLLIPKNRHLIELPTIHNMWEITGWNYDVRAVLRNHKIPKNQIFQINPITKEIIFDNFRLNHSYVRQIHKILLKYRIKYIHAYPSAAYQFCVLCRDQNLDLGFIKVFLCGSEGIIDFQKKLISDQMGIRLYSFYGHSEKLVSGGYCEYTDHYHIEPHYGYFELIDKYDQPIKTPGKIGEIVGTTLYNYGMPLIRYKTGDYATYVSDKCDKCGRKVPIIKSIQGRWDNNKIFKKDGTYLTTTALNLHNELYKVIDGIQYIQEKPGLLKVLIIKGNLFTERHHKAFIKHFTETMGIDSEIIIEFVSELVIQENGKFLQLISKL